MGYGWTNTLKVALEILSPDCPEPHYLRIHNCLAKNKILWLINQHGLRYMGKILVAIVGWNLHSTICRLTVITFILGGESIEKVWSMQPIWNKLNKQKNLNHSYASQEKADHCNKVKLLLHNFFYCEKRSRWFCGPKFLNFAILSVSTLMIDMRKIAPLGTSRCSRAQKPEAKRVKLAVCASWHSSGKVEEVVLLLKKQVHWWLS